MEELRKNAVHSLKRVTSLHAYRVIKAFWGIRLYRGQPEILSYLKHHDECSQKEIADRFGVSPASIATSIKRMCKAGLVERTQDESDRRVNRIRLTEAGKRMYKKSEEECKKIDELMFRGFSAEEIKEFTASLDRIAENLGYDGLSECEVRKLLQSEKNKTGDEDDD